MVTRRDVIIFLLTSTLLYLTVDKFTDSPHDPYPTTRMHLETESSVIQTEVPVSKGKIGGESVDIDGGFSSYMKSVISLPEWYRNNDWGLKGNFNVVVNKSLELGHDGEEEVALQNFFFGTTKGLMLEMGARDGKEKSVSYLFEKQLNWRVILIEANVNLVPGLAKNRPDALRFNLAICDSPKTVHYITHKTRDEVNGILEFMSPGFFKVIWPELLLTNGTPDWDKIVKDKRVKEIPCVPLMSVLQPLGITHINFFLLDVENAELAVLQSIDFDKIKFDVISIETNRGVDAPGARDKYIDAILELLTSKGYVVWSRFTGPNTWVRHRDFVPFKQ